MDRIRPRNPALRGVWIGLACALISWLAVQWSLLHGLEDWMLDGCFSLRGKRPMSARIVIIGLLPPRLPRGYDGVRAEGSWPP